MSGFPWDVTSNYGRRHAWDWDNTERVIDHEGRSDGPWARRQITCTRCRQTRKVWHAIPKHHIAWGCPPMPWIYRLRSRLAGRPVPSWDVNSPPPWWPR